MKNAKRIISILCIAAMLTGCGSKKETEPSAPTLKEESTEEVKEVAKEESSDERPTVTWYAVGGEIDFADRINAAATKMLNDAGIDVDFEIQWLGWGQYDQVITQMIASGEEFDIFNKDIATINNYALNGGIYEITDEDLSTHLSGVVEAMSENVVNNCRYNGELYATPVAHEFAQWFGVCYNKDIADEYDLDMDSVKTVDDLDAIFADLHEKNPDIYVVDPRSSQNIWMIMADQDFINRNSSLCLAIDMKDENSLIYNAYENEKMVEMLKKFKEWNDLGYICNDTTADLNGMFQVEGTIFCNIETYKPGAVVQNSQGVVLNDILFNNGEAYATLSDFPGGWGNAISATSDNPVAAMQVLNFAYSNKDFIDLLCFGEKGVDYDLDDNGVASWGDTGYAAAVYGSASWQMANHYIMSPTKDQADMGLADIGTILKEFNDNATTLKHTGFYFDATAYTAEVTAVANTYNEYSTQLMLGAVDDVDAVLEEFNAALYANGLQTLIDAANEQYKTFIESK